MLPRLKRCLNSSIKKGFSACVRRLAVPTSLCASSKKETGSDAKTLLHFVCGDRRKCLRRRLTFQPIHMNQEAAIKSVKTGTRVVFTSKEGVFFCALRVVKIDAMQESLGLHPGLSHLHDIAAAEFSFTVMSLRNGCSQGCKLCSFLVFWGSVARRRKLTSFGW